MAVEEILGVSSKFQTEAFMNLKLFLKRNVLIEIPAHPLTGQCLCVPPVEERRISERGHIKVLVSGGVAGIVVPTTDPGPDRNTQDPIRPNALETRDANLRLAHINDTAALITLNSGQPPAAYSLSNDRIGRINKFLSRAERQMVHPARH